MAQTPTTYAIDFGTSNSLLAAASGERTFAPIPLDPEADDGTILRTALYFRDREQGVFGVGAVRSFFENGFRGRLIRSIKRHLPSRIFTSTRIGYRMVTLEELIGSFLRVMRERANTHFDTDVRRVVLGRPARFSNDAEEDALAERRLRAAATLAGFEDIVFCAEPLAAAYDFAADLEGERVVVVADLGGGTSDFTVVRMNRHGFADRDVLGVGGVAVAGDAIDGSLVRGVVAPHFGSRATYRVPMGHVDLSMPLAFVELLASPADLTLVDRDRVREQLASIRSGLLDRSERPLLERFIALVEDGLGFSLYESVERAKRKLSDAREVVLDVDEPSIAMQTPVTREQLDDVAAAPVAAITSALSRTLADAGVAPADVEIVCFTGGTARMPLVVKAIRGVVPNAELRNISSFHAVVNGLARRAHEVGSSLRTAPSLSGASR